MENLFALTENKAAGYPAYISINTVDDDPESVRISVRTSGAENASEVTITRGLMSALCRQVLQRMGMEG